MHAACRGAVTRCAAAQRGENRLLPHGANRRLRPKAKQKQPGFAGGRSRRVGSRVQNHFGHGLDLQATRPASATDDIRPTGHVSRHREPL